MSEMSGRLSCVSPVEQSARPAASCATRLMTHVLVMSAVLFGMGNGGPKRHPGSVPVQVPVMSQVDEGQSMSAAHCEPLREPPAQPAHSDATRHGLPTRDPPTHAGYTGSAAGPPLQGPVLAPR